MNWFSRIFLRNNLHAELDEEMRLHIEERTEQLMREGMSREEAEQSARRAFGSRTVFTERSQEVWQWPRLESIVADVRLALRQLRRSPGFTIAAVLTLMFAIGANAVVFAVLNALILRPLNVPNADTLYTIERGADNDQSTSYPDYLDLRDRNRSFESLFGYILTDVGIDTGNNPSHAWTFEVTGNYFDALGIQPYLGRFFHSADEHGPNSAPYIVLSYAYWHTQFQDDRSIVGRPVLVNKHPFTILGVAPPEFRGTLLFAFPDLWVPMVDQEQVQGLKVLTDRGQRDIFMVLGHLKSGVTPAQAVTDLNSVGSWLEKTYPRTESNMTYSLARPSLIGSMLGPAVKGFMTGMMLLAGLILLAACANLGSLFAARAADRGREIALRVALGSTRTRILRGVLTEALVVSLAGGALGLFAAIVLLRQLSAWRPIPEFPLAVPAYPDAKVYLVALLLAIVSGLLFGIVPVRQILRTHPYDAVKAGAAGIVAGRAGKRITFRDLLIGLQIALCGVLVTSSLVAVRGLVRSMHSEFGFDPHNVMLADTALRLAGYTEDRVPAMQKRAIEAMETIPGVKAVGMTSQFPLGGGRWTSDVYADQTTDLRPANVAANVNVFRISPNYFRAAGTALLQGRTPTWQDDAHAPRVAVVNQYFARRLFGSVGNAIGRYFKMEDGARLQVVGVVEDGKYNRMTEDATAAVFLPFLQSPGSATGLVVRSERDPLALAEEMRTKLRALDPSLPWDIQTWTRGLDLALFPSRIATISLGVLGIMGALLSVTGIFGMASYSVSKRLRELGIRISLGARRTQVLKAALGKPVRLLAIGSLTGMLLGILASRVLASIVYQATPRDPLVLLGVVTAMSLLGIVATWIPAQRALSVNPLILLRDE